MSTAVERTRFGWSRWSETDDGFERTYTVCEPGVTEWKKDLIHAALFGDDRVGMTEILARWLVRAVAVSVVLGAVVGLLMQSGLVIAPVGLAVFGAECVLLATLPRLGQQVAARHTSTVTGEACRLVCRIAAVLDRIEPDPDDVDRDDVRTMWRLAHTDPTYLAAYGRTVREWEVSWDRLQATRTRLGEATGSAAETAEKTRDRARRSARRLSHAA